VGEKICYPHQAIDTRFNPEDPAARAYREWEKGSPEAPDYPKMSRHDRPCWDLTSVLYVFEPELFDISESGTAAVDERGVTYFTPSKNGKHRYLKLKKDSTAGIVNRLVETSALLPAPKN